MHLPLTPVRMEARLTASVRGDILTLNGEDLDFSPLPEGGTLPASAIPSPWIAGPVTRLSGVLTVPLILPHGAAAPSATLFPAALTVGNGPVPLPPYEETPDAD